MDKINILENVSALVRQGVLTKNELLDAYDKGLENNKEISHPKIANLLYYIGGGIVFIGICILVGQNWSKMNDLTRILVTLGSSMALFMTSVLLGQYDEWKRPADGFHFISALIAPLGLMVTFDVFGMQTNEASVHTLATGILLVMYLGAYFLYDRTVSLIFSIVFGTWLFFSATTFLIGGRPFGVDWEFVWYRWLVSGSSYLALGYYFSKDKHQGLTQWLYSSGIVAFLGGAFALCCMRGFSFWELIFPGLAFGVLFLSIYLRSKAFLAWGAIYLMLYIGFITNEYFSKGFGWPLALIMAGFGLMGIGYLAFYLNNKYIRTN